MYLMYIDESGNTGLDLNNMQQPIFVLSGVCIEDKKWHSTNDYFDSEKIKIYSSFKDTEIHTSQLYNSNSKSPFYQNDWKYNLSILENLAELISRLDIKIVFSTVIKKSYKKAYGNNMIVDPYVHSFSLLYTLFNKNLKNTDDFGIFFCDELSKMEKSLSCLYPLLKKQNKNIIEKTFYLNSKENNFIQIADFCSFYINKYNCITNGLSTMDDYKKDHCLRIYHKLSTLF